MPGRLMRLMHIAQVLGKHGLGHWGAYLGLGGLFRGRKPLDEKARLGQRHWTENEDLARRFASALEELGPTFVKFGQVLSTRPDLIPEVYVAELRRLQDRVAPFGADEARRIMEEELGGPITDHFARFQDEPLACGSIAQVHRAVMLTGERVVVKVRRPGIQAAVERDLDVFQWIAENLERFEAVRIFRPQMIVDEFRRSVRREMDFLSEAAYTEKFHTFYAGRKEVVIPNVQWDLTTARMLTLSEISGRSVAEGGAVAAMGVDRCQLARQLLRLFLEQAFYAGVFHADLHPGNLLIQPDGAIGMVDFGMVGHLGDDLREHLATSLIALSRRDVALIIEIYLEVGFVNDDTDVVGLRREMTILLDRYYGIPLDRVDVRQSFFEVMRIAREHKIPMPRDFVLLGKSLVAVIGYAMELDPALDIAAVVRPYAKRLMLEKISPKSLARDAALHAWHANNMLRALPGQAREFSRKLLEGKLAFRMSMPDLERVELEVDRATNRFALSVILGSVVIGSAVILHAKIPPFLSVVPGLGFMAETAPGISLLGLVGFLFAGVLGMLVAWSIWKHGKL